MKGDVIHRIWILFIFAFLLQGVLFGQYNNIVFDHYTTDDGLSNNYVYNVFQDSKGFIWIGTANGLNRFDGISFKTYTFDVKDTNSISSSGVISLIEDSLGNIWIGTTLGLCVYDRKKDNFSRKTIRVNGKLLNQPTINCCFIDSKGFLWLGTYNGLLRFALYNNPVISNSILDVNGYLLDEDDAYLPFKNDVFSIIEDKNGIIWSMSSSNSNLFHFDNQKNNFVPQIINHPEAYRLSNQQKSMIIDSDDDIYIVSSASGLFEWDRKNNIFNFYKPEGNNIGPKGTVLFALAEDKDGLIWIGDRNTEGISIFNKKTKKFNYIESEELNPYSLNSNKVNVVYKDKTGNIWVGGNLGINKYSPDEIKFNCYFSNPKLPGKLSFNNVLCFAESKSGDIWIGTDGGGLNKLNRKTGEFIHYMHSSSNTNSLSSNAIISICEDHEGTLWMGTYEGGLARMKDERFYAYYPNPTDPYSISSRNTWYVLEDSKKNLWVGSVTNGLDLFDRETGRFYHYITNNNDSTSLCNNGIIQIYEDSQQKLYIITYDGVSIIDLNKYDFSIMPPDIKFSKYTHNESINSISSNSVYCVKEDHDRNLWFGTFAAGIDKLDKSTGKFTNYSTKDGLPGNAITSIQVDDDNFLWLATDKGLVKFDPKTMDITVFDQYDGLLNKNLKGWSLITEDGEMFFGGPNGFNSLYPDQIKYNKNIPPVVITDLKIFNKLIRRNDKLNNRIILVNDISETSELVLKYKENFFAFEFVALDFTAPKKNQYAYMIEGFDKDWVYCGTRREANYTNLDAGEYTFKVKASNNDGIWNEKGVSIKIIITPPWWQTWWFRIFASIFIIGSLISFFLYKVNDLKRQKEHLQKLVLARTIEIEQKNNILVNQASELQESNALLEERQQHIEEQSEELKARADELSDKNSMLSNANATKDKFFSIIAHDLKNPFNIILGFCELLVDRFDKIDDTKKRVYINTINDSATSIFKLLENLLQWARSQTGKLEFKPEVFLLNELFSTNIMLIENMIKEKNLIIDDQLSEDIWVMADKNMINTVIRNLITNAIKFTENGKISLSAITENTYVRVIIKDSGIGMSKEAQENLFDVGSSKSTSGTRGEKGTGLGLILCKEFVEKCGGTISVESEKNKGTSFSFTIPVSAVPQ